MIISDELPARRSESPLIEGVFCCPDSITFVRVTHTLSAVNIHSIPGYDRDRRNNKTKTEELSMTVMTKTMTAAETMPSLKERVVRLAKKAALYIPAVIVFALIALYYVQLSHMGPM